MDHRHKYKMQKYKTIERQYIGNSEKIRLGDSGETCDFQGLEGMER